jgi:hypothetical protein
VRDIFSAIAEDLEVLPFEPREYIAQGDKVVALGRYSWRVKATGREFSSDFAHVCTVRDGKIVRFHEYMDTAAEVRAHKKRRGRAGSEPSALLTLARPGGQAAARASPASGVKIAAS